MLGKKSYRLLANAIAESINIDPYLSRDTSLNIFNGTLNTGKLLKMLEIALIKDNPKFDGIKFEDYIKSMYAYRLDDKVERLRRANTNMAGYTP